MLIAGATPALAPLQPPWDSYPEYVKVHGEIPGYWGAIEEAMMAIKFTGCLYECPFIDEQRGYGGTPDFWAYCGPKDQIWDLKSGNYPPMTVVQMCGYEDLAHRGRAVDQEHPGLNWLNDLLASGRPVERCGLRVEKTGRWTAFYECPKGRSYNDPMWMSAWRSCLAIYRLVPGHEYVDVTPEGTPIHKSHLSDVKWLENTLKGLTGTSYEVAVRSASNLWNLRSQYSLL
jgi:hypothetical protein